MSQLPMNAGIYAEETLAEPPRISGLAIAALVCALVFCIPGLPLIGVILGLVAIVVMIGKRHLKGRGLAIAAVVLGLIISGLQAAGGWWMYRFAQFFVVMIRDTPVEAMQAAYKGDFGTFRSKLLGAATKQDDAAIAAFVDSVRGRWGEFNGFDMSPNQRQQAAPPTGQQATNIEFEYVAQFDQGNVPALVEFRVEPIQPGAASSQATFGMPFEMGISSITFKDPVRGDIRFPVLPKPPKGGDADAPTDTATPAAPAAPAAPGGDSAEAPAGAPASGK